MGIDAGGVRPIAVLGPVSTSTIPAVLDKIPAVAMKILYSDAEVQGVCER
jgi:hypothetical protein